MAGIQVVNEQVVKLELIQPVAFFLSTLCTEYCYIVPREEVERLRDGFRVSTCGLRSVPRRGAGAWERKCSSNGSRTTGIPELPYVDRLSVHFGLSAEEIFEMFLGASLITSPICR